MHTVRPARLKHLDELVALRLLLWPEAQREEESQQVRTVLTTGISGTLPASIFVAHDSDENLIGFIEVGLRSHADGCDPAQPVGFIEGWFVLPDWRGRSVGRDLMRAAEAWAQTQGCVEMASDSWITHEEAHLAHQALGFEVVDRCIHFRKALKQS